MNCFTKFWAKLVGDHGGMKTKSGKLMRWRASELPLCVSTPDGINSVPEHLMRDAITWIHGELGFTTFVSVPPTNRCIHIEIVESPGITAAGRTRLEFSRETGIITSALIKMRSLEKKVLVHELLHCLNLEHDDIKGSVMYYRLENRYMHLTNHDKQFLRELYEGVDE